jgi:hypothetical protein
MNLSEWSISVKQSLELIHSQLCLEREVTSPYLFSLAWPLYVYTVMNIVWDVLHVVRGLLFVFHVIILAIVHTAWTMDLVEFQ